MALIKAPALYTATRLDLDEASPGSTVELTLSPSNAFLSSPKSSDRRILSDSSAIQDENTFVTSRLATESSIFFRRPERSPRAFLWRILDERLVLELQAVDLSQDARVQGEANIILRLRFPHQIRPYGISFADPEDRDALCAFVLTVQGDLYTVTLKREAFVKLSASEPATRDWYRVFQPSAFSFRTPYKLFAISALELVVSLHDGGLLRLGRTAGDDGSNWRDTFFAHSYALLGSFRGFVPWKSHNFVRFENLDLDPNTSVDAVVSPDAQHYITAGLDHTLRAWNVNTGKVGLQMDLLGYGDEPEKKSTHYLINPTQAQLIQLLDVSNNDGILYYVFAWSPKVQQFKIWGILDADSGPLGVRDMCDEVCFAPPLDDLMDASMWTLEEFHVNPRNRWRETEIWLRARAGPTSRVYTLKFDLFASRTDLQQVWQNNWVSVDAGLCSLSRINELIPQMPDTSSALAVLIPSITEQWAAFLFFPNRFGKATLETALSEFSSTTRAVAVRGATLPARSNKPLKQRVVDAIMLAASVHPSDDLEQQQTDVSSLWRQFYNLVKNLERQRAATLSFKYDASDGLPWIISADYIFTVRDCTDVEALRLNSNPLMHSSSLPQSNPISRLLEDENDSKVAILLYAARLFRGALQNFHNQTIRGAVAIEVLEEPSDSIQERIQAFDDRTNLCLQVNDDDYSRLTESLQGLGGYEELDNTVFLDAIQKLEEQVQASGGRLSICRYGAKELIRGAHAMIQTATDTLLDLLVLVVFLDLELESQDLSPQFNAQALFVELITQLRDQAVREWMATTMRLNHASWPSRHGRNLSIHKSQPWLLASSPPSLKFAADAEVTTAQTVMESIFIGDWPAIAVGNGQPRSQLLTSWCRAWLYGPDLSNSFEDLTAHVLSNLVKYGDVQAASEFEKFVPMTAWAGYVKGRLAIQVADFDKAAMMFRRSSFGLGLGHFDVHSGDRARLLDETERNFFTSGLALYYQHIVSLFDKVKAHSYVIDFTNLGIQSIRVSAEPVEEDVETDLLSRLFSACMATARYEEAYSAVSQFRNQALRRANLTTLLAALLSPSLPASTSSALLIRLPFTTSTSEADSIIAGLASKSLSAASGVGARYHKALYAFRIAHGDYRGAAEALWYRLQRLRGSGEKVADPSSKEGEEMRRCWLALCNCLSCVEPAQAWIFSEDLDASQGVNGFAGRTSFGKVGEKRNGKERSIVTLEDCRRGYQEELDRVEAVRMGKFAFVDENGGAAGEEMDVL